MSGVIEYRDDDLRDRGYCPKCAHPLSEITLEGKGYCEVHGWQFAEWQQWHDPEEEDNEK